MAGIDEIELSEEQLRRARHAYYAAISYVDERIGTVLRALADTGFDRDTVTVFAADHGEFLGERGLWYKMSFFDPSARVPLVVRGPGVVAGRRVSQPVSLLDLMPTMIELAGVGPPGAGLDGESLVGLMAGSAASERRPVVSEYHAEGVRAPAAMIRDGGHKLIVCAGDPDQLYDLEADPLELANLAGAPEHGETVTRLRDALAERLDLEAIGRRVLASQRERRLVAHALAQGEVTAWDFEPRVDASVQYVHTRADLYGLQRQARLEERQ
jgi:choline-sulfatase